MMEEYGSVGGIGLANVKLYDGDGNEIIVPQCDACGAHKAGVIGKESFAWICTMCDGKGNMNPVFNLCYRPLSEVAK